MNIKVRKLPDLALGKEWALLELLCVGLSDLKVEEMFLNLIKSENLNWEELLRQASRHKILFLLASEIISRSLQNTVPVAVANKLQQALFFNRYKMSIIRQETGRIIKALEAEKVRFVGTKGIALESSIYGGNGSRNLSDIDFMISSQDRIIVHRIFDELGYQIGTFDSTTGKVIPHSRETLIAYRLNPDHLPSRVLLTDDPLIKFIEVDIANSLTWTRSIFQVPIEIALREIIYQSIPNNSQTKLPCFNPKFQFIFTILHLFKEAWVELILTIDDKDVNLSKFTDVWRLWQAHEKILNCHEFVQILEELQLVQPILWVLEHLDRMWHTNIVKSLGMEGKVTESWLFSAGSDRHKMRQWQGTMRSRLYCLDRSQLFTD